MMSQLVVTEITGQSIEAEQIAKWYFEQWDSKNATTTYSDVLALVTSTKNKIGFYTAIDGKLTGAAEVKFQSGTAWLDGVYVDTLYRGKGISSALVAYAKQKAVELDCQTLNLKCESHLIDLYKKFGFSVIAKEGDKSIMAYDTSN
ncbi:GNAT family N-acetyltransferase [Pseudoalteromonas luteoviolacea]|nr:GNAT family N-acetyltransferase [Pseudoalteromonas luteoviolacea]